MLNNDVSLFDVGAIISDGLDFPSFQDDPGFILFFDEKIMKGFFILGNAHHYTQA
jgi:hypothetical protein